MTLYISTYRDVGCHSFVNSVGTLLKLKGDTMNIQEDVLEKIDTCIEVLLEAKQLIIDYRSEEDFIDGYDG